MQSRLASDLLTSNTVVKLNKFCKNESYCLKTQHSKPSKPTPDNSRDLMWHFMIQVYTTSTLHILQEKEGILLIDRSTRQISTNETLSANLNTNHLPGDLSGDAGIEHNKEKHGCYERTRS